MATLQSIIDLQSKIIAFERDIIILDKQLKMHSNKKCNDAMIFEKFILYEKKYPLNPLILVRFLSFLQLVNDDAILCSYSLEEIGTLYNQLSKIFKDDIEINMERVHYTNNVKDDELKAKKLFLQLKKRIKNKLVI